MILRHVRDRIDKNYEALNAKVDRNHGSLSAKIGALSTKVDSIGNKLTAFFWVVGGLPALIGVVVAVGKALHWF